MDKPKVKLTQEAQDMIDMFSELDEGQCNKLAELLRNGNAENIGRLFISHAVSWHINTTGK